MVSMISSSCQEEKRSYGSTFWVCSQKTQDRTPQFWALSCSWGKTIRVISGATSFSVHMQTLTYLELYSGCAYILILMRCEQQPWILTHLHVTDNLPWWQARTLELLIPYPSQTETDFFFSFECRISQAFFQLLLLGTGKWSPHAFCTIS